MLLGEKNHFSGSAMSSKKCTWSAHQIGRKWFVVSCHSSGNRCDLLWYVNALLVLGELWLDAGIFVCLSDEWNISELSCRPGPGGRHCQKANVEHKACEGPPCPKGVPSFRDLQCLSYDRHSNKKKGSMLTAIVNDGEKHSRAHPLNFSAHLLKFTRWMSGSQRAVW